MVNGIQPVNKRRTYYPYDPRKLDKMTNWIAWCLDILYIGYLNPLNC
jgi:hypothetical protein